MDKGFDDLTIESWPRRTHRSPQYPLLRRNRRADVSSHRNFMEWVMLQEESFQRNRHRRCYEAGTEAKGADTWHEGDSRFRGELRSGEEADEGISCLLSEAISAMIDVCDADQWSWREYHGASLTSASASSS